MAKEVFKCAHSDVLKVSNLLLMQNPKNNNKHPKDQIERLAKIIDFQGQRSPIVISKRSGFIVKGHGRLFALDKLGWENAAVDYQEYKTEAEEYADMTADNEIARWAEFDETKFLDDIKDIDLGDFDLLGLKDFKLDISEPFVPLTDEDAVPENVETRCKLGDIWKLGGHRLMCGDGTNIQHVESLMDGSKADMVFTDPPYNYTPTNRGAGSLGAQASKVGKKIEFISSFDPNEFLNVLLSLSVESFSSYIFCNTELVPEYLNWANENNFNFNILTWHKTKFIPANSNHHYPDTEYCIFISKRPIFHSGLSPDHYRKYWIQDKDGNDLHPTMKPISIIEKCIELNSNDSILDLFGGSGSTMIAAQKTNRKCFMMELDPHYCDVILKRWEQYTGKKAELTNGQT